MKFALVSSCVAIALVTLAADAAPGARPVSFPLVKNENYKPNIQRALARAKAKYSKHIINPLKGVTTIAAGSTVDAVGRVPVTDYLYDVEYYGTVGVGTPAQNLKINFDTGSSDFWFASTLCSSCTTHTRYDSTKSSTYIADGRAWSIAYGDGSTASGILAKDSVNLGGLVIKNQTINLAKKESSSFASDPIDGIMGLGFNTITTVSGIKTPVDNLISQGLITNPIYGVYLGKQSLGGGGEYIFGGYDSTKINGTLTTIPINKSKGFWGVTVSKVTKGSTAVYSSSLSAILDTGTTLLLFTDSVAAKVAAAYGAKDNGDGTYTISCDTSKLQPLYLTLGGVQFKIPSSSLIFVQEGSTCYASFAYGGLSFAILGDTFLKNNYVIYNQQVPNVQIAPAIGNY